MRICVTDICRWTQLLYLTAQLAIRRLPPQNLALSLRATIMMFNISRLMHRNARIAACAATVTLALAVGLATVLAQDEDERTLPIEPTHSVLDAPAPVPNAVFGSGPAVHPGDRICTTPTQFTPNVDTDC